MVGIHTVLIVEDDVATREVLEMRLMDAGFASVSTGNISGAKAILTQGIPCVDAVLLDVGLPDGNGLELCSWTQREGVMVPILVLTGVGDEQAILEGFKAGAVDYVIKPYRIAELTARLRAQIRRAEETSSALIAFGPYDLRPDMKILVHRTSGRRTKLTSREVTIIKMLRRAEPLAVPRMEMLKELWGYNPGVITHTVETHVYRLRQKIEPNPSEPTIIVTEGHGYRLANEKRQADIRLNHSNPETTGR